MSKKIIIGNWKMNPSTFKEARKLFLKTAKSFSVRKTSVAICPPFTYVAKLKGLSKKIELGAQDVFWEASGAYTGEISADMLSDAGVRYVILGHSERRQMGEDDSLVNRKIKSCLSKGLIPVLCVGEGTRDGDHRYLNFVKSQIESCLQGVSRNSVSKIIIAYEPIWAISSTLDRKDATSDEIREMSIFIRKILTDKFGKEAKGMKIIYGGSVNLADTEEFLRSGGVDGLLVGRASLDAEKFSGIIKKCEALEI